MLASLFKRFIPAWDTPTTPVFDGVLRPNQDLDLCRLVGRELGAVNDVALTGEFDPVVSAGNRLICVTGHWFAPSRSVLATLEGECGALASLDDGGLAAAGAGSRISFICLLYTPPSHRDGPRHRRPSPP